MAGRCTSAQHNSTDNSPATAAEPLKNVFSLSVAWVLLRKNMQPPNHCAGAREGRREGSTALRSGPAFVYLMLTQLQAHAARPTAH